MIPTDTSGLADVVLTTKGDLATWTTERVRKGVSATNYTGLQADSAIADGLTYGATARSTMTGTGDLLYSSSANTLSKLSVASNGDTLQLSAGVPAWVTVASGGGKMELVGSDILTSAGSTLQVAISPAINQSDIAYLRLVVNVKTNDATADGQDTILRVNSISDTTYNQDGIECRAGSSSILNNVAQSYVMICNNNHDGNRYSVTDLVCNSASENIEMNTAGGGADGYFTAFAYNSTSSQTTFSDITVLAGGGNNAIDSRIDVYKITK